MRKRSLIGLASLAATLMMPIACKTRTFSATRGESAANGSDNWQAIRAERESKIRQHLEKHQVAYRWFADFPFGMTSDQHDKDQTESLPGYPFLLLKLLPQLAPDMWSKGTNFLEVVGLFEDERLQNYPIARGFGWTGLARADQRDAANSNLDSVQGIDFASVTCGACHTARVQKPDGTFVYIDGGANAEFNLPQFRLRQLKTLEHAIAERKKENSQRSDHEALAEAFNRALDVVTKQDKNYFYKNYVYQAGGFTKAFDMSYEERQVQLAKKHMTRLAANYLGRARAEVLSVQALLAKNYPDAAAQKFVLESTPGMADATGVSTSMLFFGRTVLPEIKSGTPPQDALRAALADPKKNAIMPRTRGLTDFMVVWRQADRQPKWQDDTLVDGGGQWNGNIPIPMYRNMAAQLTLGLGKDTDLRVSAFAREFLDELPAPPYPFDVNMDLAERGEKLYQQNCEPCHKPNNGAVYDMGTDTGRSFVVSGPMVAAAQENLSNICNERTTLGAPVPETSRHPCAEFAGKTLGQATRPMVLRSRDAEPGYQARALSGVWAQAPYLHGGTVPTLFHLLVPKTRPSQFIKSATRYDPVNVGFEWSRDENDQSDVKIPGGGVVFDTTLFASVFGASAERPLAEKDLPAKKGDPLSTRGHDTDHTDPTTGATYTLNFDDRQDEAMAIIEYMKTL